MKVIACAAAAATGLLLGLIVGAALSNLAWHIGWTRTLLSAGLVVLTLAGTMVQGRGDNGLGL